MSQKSTNSRERRRRGPRCGLVAALVSAGILTGCSSVPDAMNPVEWYRDTRDWITGTDEPAAETAAAKPSNADSKEFPKLNSVPPRPAPPSAAERKQLSRSLAADREAARYSDEVIRQQTGSSGLTAVAPPPPKPAPAPPAPSVAAVPAPAPSPMPPPAASPMPAPSAPSAATASPSAFPPMPAAPPPPPPMKAEVPPMPTSFPSPTPVPQAGMSAPPMPQPVPAQPSAPSVAPAAGPLKFGPPPSDIALGAAPSAARVGAGAQRFAAATPYSSRFPAGTGAVSPAYELAGRQTLATVRFGTGSSRINAAGRSKIRQAARKIKQAGVRVRVVGHASSRTRNLDPMSHRMANFKVSLDRANAVARELRRRGVPPAAITVEAVSDTQPAYIEVMPAGEAANRRVVILVDN